MGGIHCKSREVSQSESKRHLAAAKSRFQLCRCCEISTPRTRRSIARSRLIHNALGLWEVKVKLAIAEKADFSVYEQAVEKGKSFPMSGEERLKIVGNASRSSPIATQVPAAFATGSDGSRTMHSQRSGFASDEVFRHRHCSKRFGR